MASDHGFHMASFAAWAKVQGQCWLSLEVGRANRALAPTLKSADAGVERLRAAWG